MPIREFLGIFVFIYALLLFTDWAFNHKRLGVLRVLMNLAVAILAMAMLYLVFGVQ